jgi:hypothetical protein
MSGTAGGRNGFPSPALSRDATKKRQQQNFLISGTLIQWLAGGYYEFIATNSGGAKVPDPGKK